VWQLLGKLFSACPSRLSHGLHSSAARSLMGTLWAAGINPLLRMPSPQWALPASIFQQRITIPSQEDAEGFDGLAFTAGGYGW